MWRFPRKHSWRYCRSETDSLINRHEGRDKSRPYIYSHAIRQAVSAAADTAVAEDKAGVATPSVGMAAVEALYQDMAVARSADWVAVLSAHIAGQALSARTAAARSAG